MDLNTKENFGMLNRIDERTTLLIGKLGELNEEIHILKKTLDKTYVTQAEFTPVKNLVYGVTSVIMLSVFGALIAIVINKP